MRKHKTSICSTIVDMFESNESKSLKDIYESLLEHGFEDKGSITKHTIRGIIHKLYKTRKIRRISNGIYIKNNP